MSDTLTDEQLRDLALYAEAREASAMATELLALRARNAKLEGMLREALRLDVCGCDNCFRIRARIVAELEK